jgi:hypothetical protein
LALETPLERVHDANNAAASTPCAPILPAGSGDITDSHVTWNLRSGIPEIAGGHLYLVSARGVITVVKTGSEFRIVHQTDLNAPVAATPALDSKSLYLRTADALWAFR